MDYMGTPARKGFSILEGFDMHGCDNVKEIRCRFSQENLLFLPTMEYKDIEEGHAYTRQGFWQRTVDLLVPQTHGGQLAKFTKRVRAHVYLRML